MMTNEPATLPSPYHVRFARVLRHIEANLCAELNAEALSGVAAFSKYHFLRQFAALYGLSVHRYVQLARLKRASFRLAFRDDDSVLSIALESGYDAPEAFARAFKQRFGQTPSEFRAQPEWAAWHAAYQSFSETRVMHMKRSWSTEDVRIVDVAEILVGVLEHRGDPAVIGDSVRRFIAWRKQVGLHPKKSETFQILYDDPSTTPPAEFRCDLCAASSRPIEPNAFSIVAKTIPGGRCAVLRLIGSDDGLGDAAHYLYGVWLPQSGEELRDFPLYCQRVSFFPDVPEGEAVTDLFLPLR